MYQDNAYYYSRNIIQNRQLLPVKAEETTDLPKNCVAFRLNTGQEETKAKVIINGTKTEEITSGETVYFAGLDSGTRVDASSIKVLPQDASQDTSKWIIELDCAEEETFELSVACLLYTSDAADD